MERFILEALVSILRLEISNQIKVQNNEIVIYLLDGTKARIITKM